jgi:hypothetical protein
MQVWRKALGAHTTPTSSHVAWITCGSCAAGTSPCHTLTTLPLLLLQAIHGSLLREAPACFIAGDWRSLGSPAANIQQLPVATMMYGFSVAVCMSSALSAPGGLGLGTLGFDEVGGWCHAHFVRLCLRTLVSILSPCVGAESSFK